MIEKTLGSVAAYYNGRAFKPAEWKSVGLPIIRIQNLTNEKAKYNFTDCKYEEKYRVCKGDLLFAWSASLGAYIWKNEDAWLNQHIFKVVPNEGIDKDYLFYYLKKVTTELYSKTHGTGMVHITKTSFMATTIPVPDIREQRNIVIRIEELFSELDKSLETLQKIKQQLSVYRQAVLKEALEGKLTDSWRRNRKIISASTYIKEIKKDNRVVGTYEPLECISLPKLPEQWKWVSIGDISTGAEYGTSKKSQKNGKVPVLRMGNILNGSFDWNNLVYSDDDSEITKYKLHHGDVLFNRTNSPELVGKTASYKGEYPAIFAGYLIRINQVLGIDCDFLTYYLNSHTAKQYGNKVKTDGVNQSNINSRKLYSYPFPLCSLEEQKQVVFELESRLSVCDSIEQNIDMSFAQADAMRQSILKQAFEGRLM